jgi:hypothetical protein
VANRTKYTAKRKQIILDALAGGVSFGGAAARAGVTKMTLFNWRRTKPGFGHACENAYALGTARIVDAAWKRAFAAHHDGLLIFLLKSRDPERFGRKMLEARVTGDQSNPITIEHQMAPGEVQPGVRLVIVGDGDDMDTVSGTEAEAAAD